MFNCRFRMAKRPLRQDMAACIAFWGVSTHKTGHLLPESLQRFWGGFRAGSCGVWFQPILAAYRALFSVALRAICSHPALQMSHFCTGSVPVLYRYPLRGVPVPPNSAALNDIATLHAVIPPLKTVAHSHTHYAPVKLVQRIERKGILHQKGVVRMVAKTP